MEIIKASIKSSIEDFSKHLLVTIFAIFAFTSKTIVEGDSNISRYLFWAALGLSIFSLYFGYKVFLCYIDDSLNSLEKLENEVGVKKKSVTSTTIDSTVIITMKKNLTLQFQTSILALIMLATSIIFYLC